MNDIEKVLNDLKNSDLSSYKIAKDTGITEMTIGNYRNGKTKPTKANANMLLKYFSEIKGEILPNPLQISLQKKIPLVSEQAVAGFGNVNFSISEQDVKDYYVIPKFKYLKVDFMIEIHGSSMYPKYNSGDIVACSILRDRKFLQWNKCHIIASREQGILCKRLRMSEKKNHLLAVSDNKNYPPFDIPEEDIAGIALVVGVIRLE